VTSRPSRPRPDHTKITTFDVGTTTYGFGLTQHTGFPVDNYISYMNSSTANTYVCGPKLPVQAPGDRPSRQEHQVRWREGMDRDR
jgi:hypothetical protein